eukprot:gnl/Trimastix_PCT/2872.p1 GENE.gnl/Trimastix_PCT/2872~~gnl/Trimastix_PCT/2872.p1  ORF type:complete len:270 (+),score=79.01 gnl/Trimastix_PCT/2872:209-1018(+)
MCLARTLLGPACKQAILELNASDDRGIDVVRVKIKTFAQKKVTLPAGRHKIVILDEIDSMTEGAQQALRRTMEIYSGTTRFALACNDSSKVIEPIQSRCAILRYTRLSDAEVLRRVMIVAQAEHVPTTSDGLEAILFTAQGDLRQALNNLQSTFYGFGTVSADNVWKVCDQPRPATIQRLLLLCRDRHINSALSEMQALWKMGYSALDIITTLFHVVHTLDLPEQLMLDFIREIGQTHMRILEGCADIVQLSGLLARLCKATNQHAAVR